MTARALSTLLYATCIRLYPLRMNLRIKSPLAKGGVRARSAIGWVNRGVGGTLDLS